MMEHFCFLLLLFSTCSARPQDSETCPPGQKWEPIFGECEPGDTEPDTTTETTVPADECPPGQIKKDPLFGVCEPRDTEPITRTAAKPKVSANECPLGQKWDPVFSNCEDDTSSVTPAPPPPPPPPTATPTCFNSINDIENAIFTGETRQAFNDCNPERPCSFYKKSGYACAPSWTCHNNTIITDGKGLIDVRQVDDECAETSGTLDISDSKCENVQDVCCLRPDFRAERCEDTKPNVFGDEKYEVCGRSNSKLTITGIDKDDISTAAQPGEFPHMCVVYRLVDNIRAYVAGASLIAPNKVVTVAHKFLVIRGGKTTDLLDKTKEFYIRCGEHNVKNEQELLPSQESQVVQISLHPQYDSRRVRNNLAILRTRENFVYAEHIGPVCLPIPNENFDGETDCYSSGWGADAYSSFGVFSDALKKVQMPVVDSASCQARFRAHERFKKKPTFTIHPSWMCIGGEPGVDTCKGDGGSPHVCRRNNGEFVQVGAVAWGIDCGGDVPAVYSSIPSAMCWIDWVMSCIPNSVNNIDTTTVDDVDIRGVDDSVESFNRLTIQECGAWADQNQDLFDQCSVDYGAIDERNL